MHLGFKSILYLDELHTAQLHTAQLHSSQLHSAQLHTAQLHSSQLHMYHTICRFITRRQRGRNPFSLCNYFVFWSGGALPISFLKYKTVYIHIPCCQNIPRVDDQFSCHRIESLQSHDLFLDPGSSGQTIPVASWDFLWRSSSIHLLYLQQKTFSQNYGRHISLLS